MRYQDRLTNTAEADVESVLRWFASQRAMTAGAAWLSSWMARIETLETNSDRCRVADESEEIGGEIRELLFGKRRGMYRPLFRIERQTVHLLRVWHTARDTPTRDDLEQ